MPLGPNKSFKPNLLRSTKAMAEKACHGFGSTTQVGLTQVLGAMDRLRLRDSANRLLLEVERAKQFGYASADFVLTPEIRRLLPEILELRLAEPVTLQFTAGPARGFSETELGKCKELEEAWADFCIEVQGEREFVEQLKAQMGWSA